MPSDLLPRINVNGGGILNDGNIGLPMDAVTILGRRPRRRHFRKWRQPDDQQQHQFPGTVSVVGNSVGGGVLFKVAQQPSGTAPSRVTRPQIVAAGLSITVGTVSVESDTIAYNSAPDGSGYVKFLNNGGTTFTNTSLADQPQPGL